jgi:hypothetical protein
MRPEFACWITAILTKSSAQVCLDQDIAVDSDREVPTLRHRHRPNRFLDPVQLLVGLSGLVGAQSDVHALH